MVALLKDIYCFVVLAQYPVPTQAGRKNGAVQAATVGLQMVALCAHYLQNVMYYTRYIPDSSTRLF